MQSSVLSQKCIKNFSTGRTVMPAKAGIQKSLKFLNSGSRQ
jgi:hypothetical protein